MKNCSKCNSENINYVRYIIKNGVQQLRKQCFNCGYLDPLNYKRSLVDDFELIPFVDKHLLEDCNRKSIERGKIRKVLYNYSQKRFYEQVLYYRNVYLKSPEWAHKRKLIMEFYNWTCQECGNNASDLHHNTYDNIFREKFEDLTPLCRTCHGKKHNEWN